jgi:hypothetical protein
MLSCFMVSGLSALGFVPNTPATGQPVCTLVTPTLFNGNSYPFSFQYISRPSPPSWLNGNPPIFFSFIPLQATSLPTGGYTPPFAQSVLYEGSLFAYPLYLQWFPDSFAEWTHLNPFSFYRLRTLSIAMGVYPPSRRLYRGSISPPQNLLSVSRCLCGYHSGTGGQPGNSCSEVLPMYCRSAIPILLV